MNENQEVKEKKVAEKLMKQNEHNENQERIISEQVNVEVSHENTQKQRQNEIVAALDNKEQVEQPSKVVNIEKEKNEVKEKESEHNFSENASSLKDIVPDVKSDKKYYHLLNREEQIQMYEETFTHMHVGDIINGTILKITDKEVMIDIGFKSEGSIPLSEFEDSDDLKIGNKIWVYIEQIEDSEGKPLLSKKKADFYRSFDKIEQIYKNGEKVKGVLKRRVKGGMIVDILGLDAFLPGSHVSTKKIPNLDQLIDREYEFKIISIDKQKRNIIISHREVLEEDMRQKRTELFSKLEEGQELIGEVKNITNYGVFIDLGGVDGLLHITDMSWGRIEHPSEMLNIGDKLKVKILDFDKEEKRVSLGLKQLVPHPWKNIEIKYPEGSKVKGKVTNLTNYGAFVELERGVEGLVHISEMSWTKHITHPKHLLKVGDNVEAIVLSVDKERHHISLGMKQIEPDPWLTVHLRHPVGSKITGKIKNITPFGAFIEIEPGIDGLIHISDISWTRRIYHPNEILKIGDEVTAVVLNIDKVLRRISMGIKQLEEDPWQKAENDIPINTEVEGEVVKVINKGLLIRLPNGIEGFAPLSHLNVPGLKDPSDSFNIGEKLQLKVIELDIQNRRLILSARAYFFGRDEKEIKKYIKKHRKTKDKVKSEETDTEKSEEKEQVKNEPENKKSEENKE